jgi:4-hydroxy-2-oxoheptanedioate aldolase
MAQTETRQGTYLTRTSRVKRVMRQGKIALGTYANFTDPSQLEIAGLGGWDAVIMMWEYTSIDFGMLEHQIRAAENVDIDYIVRIPETNTSFIKRVLDIGAHGIYLPHDGRGIEGIKQALNAMRYPPEGSRTLALRVRANGYGYFSGDERRVPEASRPGGYYTDMWQTWKEKIDDVVVIVPIEDRRAFDEVEEIAKLDGIDLFFVSVFDIADALGVPYTDRDAILGKWEELGEIAKRYGKKLCVPYDHTAQAIKPQDLVRFNAGYAHVVPDATTTLLKAYQAKTQEIRNGLGYRPS